MPLAIEELKFSDQEVSVEKTETALTTIVEREAVIV